MTGVAESDEVVIGIAPWRELVPGGLAPVILPVMYLQGLLCPADAARLAVAVQNGLSLIPPFGPTEKFYVCGFEECHTVVFCLEFKEK